MQEISYIVSQNTVMYWHTRPYTNYMMFKSLCVGLVECFKLLSVTQYKRK